jgi:hypothetical protein
MRIAHRSFINVSSMIEVIYPEALRANLSSECQSSMSDPADWDGKVVTSSKTCDSGSR